MIPRAALGLLVALGLGLSLPAQAGALDDALRAGQVGERWDGYLGAVGSSPSPAIQELGRSIVRCVVHDQEMRNADTAVEIEEMRETQRFVICQHDGNEAVVRQIDLWRIIGIESAPKIILRVVSRFQSINIDVVCPGLPGNA